MKTKNEIHRLATLYGSGLSSISNVVPVDTITPLN